MKDFKYKSIDEVTERDVDYIVHPTRVARVMKAHSQRPSADSLAKFESGRTVLIQGSHLGLPNKGVLHGKGHKKLDKKLPQRMRNKLMRVKPAHAHVSEEEEAKKAVQKLQEATERKDTEFCHFRNFVIKSSDKQLDVCGGGKVLQLLSSKTEEVTIEFEATCNKKEKDSCGTVLIEKNHHDAWLGTRLNSIAIPGTSIPAKLEKGSLPKSDNYKEFIARHIKLDLQKLPHSSLRFSNETTMCSDCNDKYAATVDVYPNLGWSGSLALGAQLKLNSTTGFEGFDWVVKNELAWCNSTTGKERKISFDLKNDLGELFDVVGNIIEKLKEASSSNVFEKFAKNLNPRDK